MGGVSILSNIHTYVCAIIRIIEFPFHSISPPNDQNDGGSDKTPTSPLREIQTLREQLEQQSLQTRQALSQLMLVREQLISETNARIEAQVSDYDFRMSLGGEEY